MARVLAQVWTANSQGPTVDAEHVDQLELAAEPLDHAPHDEAHDEDVAVEDGGGGGQLCDYQTMR